MSLRCGNLLVILWFSYCIVGAGLAPALLFCPPWIGDLGGCEIKFIEVLGNYAYDNSQLFTTITFKDLPKLNL